jgi:hypothetical protein
MSTSTTKRKILSAVLTLGLFLPLLWSPSPASAEPAEEAADPEAGATPMTYRRLRQMVIPGVCNLPTRRYRQGVHPDSREYPTDGPHAWIVGFSEYEEGPVGLKLGHLDTNGVIDGLVVVRCAYSTHSSYQYDHVFGYRANGTLMGRIPIARSIPPSWVSPIVLLHSTFIRSRIAVIRVRHWADSDAHCCPSRETTLRFRYQNGAFRKQ